MSRKHQLYGSAALASCLLAGTVFLVPIAGAEPTPNGPIIKGPTKMSPVPPLKMKPIPPPKLKPIPPLKKLPPPPLPKKPPPPPPGKKPPPPPGHWYRPYVLPPIGYWIWQGITINAYEYEGCGYEYYKWKSTGSSYWRRQYRECRGWE